MFFLFTKSQKTKQSINYLLVLGVMVFTLIAVRGDGGGCFRVQSVPIRTQ